MDGLYGEVWASQGILGSGTAAIANMAETSVILNFTTLSVTSHFSGAVFSTDR